MGISSSFRNAFFTIPFILLSPAMAIDQNVFHECMLKNGKTPGLSDLALRSIGASCAHLATPKKCRDLQFSKDITNENPYGDPLATRGAYIVGSKEDCEHQCSKANYLSRKFGECSTG